jgi:hypothetical protein
MDDLPSHEAALLISFEVRKPLFVEQQNRSEKAGEFRSDFVQS